MIEWIKEQSSVRIEAAVLERQRDVELFCGKYIAIDQILFQFIGCDEETGQPKPDIGRSDIHRVVVVPHR